jgi:translocation and assembly module TamB
MQGTAMRIMARALRWLGSALGLLIVVPLAAFGLLQTQAGKTWLARTIAQTVSSPDFSVTIEGLGGIVPFRLEVDRIEIGDRDGSYLTLRDISLDLSATALLAGRLHIWSLGPVVK